MSCKMLSTIRRAKALKMCYFVGIAMAGTVNNWSYNRFNGMIVLFNLEKSVLRGENVLLFASNFTKSTNNLALASPYLCGGFYFHIFLWGIFYRLYNSRLEFCAQVWEIIAFPIVIYVSKFRRIYNNLLNFQLLTITSFL